MENTLLEIHNGAEISMMCKKIINNARITDRNEEIKRISEELTKGILDAHKLPSFSIKAGVLDGRYSGNEEKLAISEISGGYMDGEFVFISIKKRDFNYDFDYDHILETFKDKFIIDKTFDDYILFIVQL